VVEIRSRALPTIFDGSMFVCFDCMLEGTPATLPLLGIDVLLDRRIPARMFRNRSNKPSFVARGGVEKILLWPRPTAFAGRSLR
jgi:hypothetical protein